MHVPPSEFAQSALLPHAIAKLQDPLGPQRLPRVAGGPAHTP
jgi:hypothetical protein